MADIANTPTNARKRLLAKLRETRARLDEAERENEKLRQMIRLADEHALLALRPEAVSS